MIAGISTIIRSTEPKKDNKNLNTLFVSILSFFFLLFQLSESHFYFLEKPIVYCPFASTPITKLFNVSIISCSSTISMDIQE